MASFSELIRSEKPVLVDFFAEWCGPCKTLAPIIKEVKAKAGSNARVLKIDIDKNPQLARQLNIQGVPTLMIYKSGEMKWRQSGVLSAQSILQTLQSYY
ncbi:MAG: thioredoxin [Owenweeksia sp.]